MQVLTFRCRGVGGPAPTLTGTRTSEGLRRVEPAANRWWLARHVRRLTGQAIAVGG